MSERFEFTRVDRVVDGETEAFGLPAILDRTTQRVAPFPMGKDADVREFLRHPDHVIQTLFVYVRPGENVSLFPPSAVVYELSLVD